MKATGNPQTRTGRIGLEQVPSCNPTDQESEEGTTTLSVSQTSADVPPLSQLPALVKGSDTAAAVGGTRAGEREPPPDSNEGHLWAFQGEGVVVTTIAHG